MISALSLIKQSARDQERLARSSKLGLLQQMFLIAILGLTVQASLLILPTKHRGARALGSAQESALGYQGAPEGARGNWGAPGSVLPADALPTLISQSTFKSPPESTCMDFPFSIPVSGRGCEVAYFLTCHGGTPPNGVTSRPLPFSLLLDLFSCHFVIVILIE